MSKVSLPFEGIIFSLRTPFLCEEFFLLFLPDAQEGSLLFLHRMYDLLTVGFDLLHVLLFSGILFFASDVLECH